MRKLCLHLETIRYKCCLMTADSQYVHDDTDGPTVHRASVSLPANHLRSWEQKMKNKKMKNMIQWHMLQTDCSLLCGYNPVKWTKTKRVVLHCATLLHHLPRYSGVPHGSLMSPFSSFASWKSLITILECFRRLKYTKFSNWWVNKDRSRQGFLEVILSKCWGFHFKSSFITLSCNTAAFQQVSALGHTFRFLWTIFRECR